MKFFSTVPRQSGKSFQSGQILLVVVLVMVVVLTIGLSLATRSITNLRLTVEEDSSQRALSAAEAGVEQALRSNNPSNETFVENKSAYTATVSQLAGTEFLANNGSRIAKNDPLDVWLSDYSPDKSLRYRNPWNGTLVVYWGSPSDQCLDSASNTMPALEIVTLTGTTANPITTYYPVDPCDARRTSSNNFCPNAANASCPVLTKQVRIVKGKTFAYNVQIPIPAVNGGLLARIVPLYAGSTIAVAGTTAGGAPQALRSQGSVIESVGNAGSTQRKISVFRGHPKLPSEFFPFTFFSP